MQNPTFSPICRAPARWRSCRCSISARGRRAARQAKTLADLRAIPWVFSWSQNRQMLTGWYGVGSGLKAFLDVRKEPGLDLLRRMFKSARLFRLVIDEVEKTLLTVDLVDRARIRRPDRRRRGARPDLRGHRARVPPHLRAGEQVSGDDKLAQRFPQYRRRLARRLKTMNEVSRQQVQLLRAWRTDGQEDVRNALLLSINCAAAGLGWTG